MGSGKHNMIKSASSKVVRCDEWLVPWSLVFSSLCIITFHMTWELIWRMQYRILYTYTITCIIMYISTQWRSIDAQTINAQIHDFHPHGQIEFKPMQKDTVTLLHLLGLEAYTHTHTSHKHHQTIRPCLSPRWRNPCKVFVVSGVVYGSGFNWWVEPTKGIAQVQQRRPPSILLSCIPRKLSTKTVPPCKKIGWSHKKRTFVEYVENHVCGTRNRRPPTKAN